MSDALTLHRVPEDWTPPASWERMTIPTNEAGDVLDTPRVLGWRAAVSFTLDITTRELFAQPVGYADPDTGDSERAERAALLGEFATTAHFVTGILPARLLLGGLPLDYEPHVATAEVINSLLEEVEPLAREVADGAIPVHGQSGTTLDWSPEATDAYQAARHLIERRPYRGTEYDFPYQGVRFLDAAEVFRHRPDLVDPEWSDLGDQDLSHVFSRIGYRVETAVDSSPELREALTALARGSRVSPPDDRDTDVEFSLRLVGRRAWLHQYRRAAADGREPVDIRWWPGNGVHAHRVQDTSTDEDLEAITTRAVQDAAAQGIKLVGTTGWAAELRTQRRTEVRDQLAAIGAEITETEAKLKPKKQQRRAVLARVLSWGTVESDSHLGRLSGLSHTAVRSLRDALTDETDD
ncbi:hypothetical protein ABZ820_33810 [Streptomyces diacarni]|uniref:hypothetical protein n=1 Tax=Streptomyces diacarni TaxID=2800381 RepID=UPI0034112E94